MNRIFKDEINARLEIINKLATKTEEKLASLPEGRIKIKRHGQHVYYYVEGCNIKERILTAKDGGLKEDLLKKSYLKKVLSSIEREAEFLKKMKESYPDNVAETVFDDLPADRKESVTPIVLSDEQYVQKWLNTPYVPKVISKDVPVYMTLKGERVRSKSEMIIADHLYINGIPYKYECPLKVGNKVFHPDFTILKISDRKIVYLEHCGKVGDQEYGNDMVTRANDYTLAGISQGDRLFFTFETADKPLDVRVLDKMINECFR